MSKIKLMALVVVAAGAMLSAFADLPSGYRQIDYVDTDGTQWVNTLFRPSCTNAVEIKASVVNPNSTQFLYCTRRTTSNRMYSLCITGGKTRFDYQAKNADASYPLTGGVPYVFFASPSEDADQEGVDEMSKKWTLTCTVDGNSAGHVAGAYFTTDTKAYFCLFGAYASGGSSSAASLTDDTTVSYKAKCRFYYFKVWDTKDKGNLLCHIIPAYGESEASPMARSASMTRSAEVSTRVSSQPHSPTIQHRSSQIQVRRPLGWLSGRRSCRATRLSIALPPRLPRRISILDMCLPRPTVWR